VMIDTLIRLLPAAEASFTPEVPEKYFLVTLHRAANVDDSDWLSAMLRELVRLSEQVSVVFPVHPRTRERIKLMTGLQSLNGRLQLLEPAPYLEFLRLQKHAMAVITDSGGIQEETTFLGVPCLTVRENTERPITVTLGTNVVVGRSIANLRAEVEKCLHGTRKPGVVPPLWDGLAGQRIADILMAKS
jgi:UDP-N-acetylglucosamine 2-epimerase (non-hydrolysing)